MKARTFIKGLWREIYNKRKFLLVGGIAGAFAAWYTISLGFDLNTIVAAGKSFADDLLGRNADPIKFAATKLYAVFMLIGMGIAYLTDMLFKR